MNEKFSIKKRPEETDADIVEKNTPKKEEPNMFGITWNNKQKVFVVRLLMENGKPRFREEFYVAANSKEETLQQAIAWRNETVTNNLLPCHVTREGIYLKNNKTGVKGVSRNNGRKVYAAAWYDEDGKKGRAQFSEESWGARQAFYMAWATRLSKKKIFANRLTKSNNKKIEAKGCFQIVYDGIGMNKAEEIWEREKQRVFEIEKTEDK